MYKTFHYHNSKFSALLPDAGFLCLEKTHRPAGVFSCIARGMARGTFYISTLFRATSGLLFKKMRELVNGFAPKLILKAPPSSATTSTAVSFSHSSLPGTWRV
jgi:hypothetical protein